MRLNRELTREKLDFFNVQGIYLGNNKTSEGKTALLFPGHGAQYPNMLKELVDVYPIVRDTFKEADEEYKNLTGEKLSDCIFYDNEENKSIIEEKMTKAEVMQPAIFTANMALYRLLRSFGIDGDVYIGHSLGEIAALAAAEVFTFREGLKITYYRAWSLNQIEEKNRGTMISLKLRRQDTALKKVLNEAKGYCNIALHNSPQQVIISGEERALNNINDYCSKNNIISTKLPVSHGFHSNLLDPAVSHFEEKLKAFKYRKPKKLVFSTISSKLYDNEILSNEKMPSFLSSQLITPFSFCDIVTDLYETMDIKNYIEVGPRNILSKLVKVILKDKDIHSMASNIPKVGDLISVERLKAYMYINRLNERGQDEMMKSSLPVEQNKKGIEISIRNIIMNLTGYPDSLVKIDSEPMLSSLALNKKIFSQVVEKIREEFELTEDMIQIDEKISLKQIVDAIKGNDEVAKQVAITIKDENNSDIDNYVDINTKDVEKEVKTIIELKTGYPVEMLEGDLDLEADLGIDSVKQAEILGMIREKYGYELDTNVDIKEFNTIDKITQYTISRLDTGGVSIQESSVSEVAGSINIEEVEKEVKEIIELKTGYPVEMLEGDLDLEADLGIDSVKQAEILGMIREKYGYELDTNVDIKEFNTIDKITQYTIGRLNTDGATTQENSVSEVAASIDTEKVEKEVKEIIELKTGYPVEMLEGALDLEADLGIDSVKQAEILGMIREKYGYELDPNVDIKEFNTIDRIVEYTLNRLSKDAPINVEKESVLDRINEYCQDEKAKRYIPITVEREYNPNNGKKYSFKNKNFIIIEDRIDGEITKGIARFVTNEGGKLVIITDNEDKFDSFRTVTTKYTSIDEIKFTFKKAKELLKTVHGFINLYPLINDFSLEDVDWSTWEDEVETSYNIMFYGGRSIYEDLEGLGQDAAVFAATSTGGIFGLEEGTSLNPIGGITSGFVKSLYKEIPTINAKVVDFTDTKNIEGMIEILSKEFSLIEQLVEIGYVNGRRKTICIVPKEVQVERKEQPYNITSEDVILVTGGGRGINYEFAKGLAEIHNPTIVVSGRTKFPSEDEIWIKMSDEEFINYEKVFLKETKLKNTKLTPIEIKQRFGKIKAARELFNNVKKAKEKGYKLYYVACDVVDNKAVVEMAEEIEKRFGRVTAIVNGAGLPSFGRLPKKPEQHSLNVVRVKAHGFYNLYHAFKESPLKFFLSIGSISGRFGMDGQVDYVAGADIIAKMSFQLFRHRPDLQWFVIGWTAWSGVGMAANPQVEKVQKEQRGLEYLSVNEGVQKFLKEVIYGGEYPEVLVFSKIGTNKPLGQFDLLDESEEKFVVTQGNNGEIYDRIKYPLLQKIEKVEKDREITISKDLTLHEDIYLKDHMVEGKYVYAGVMHVEAFCEIGTLMNEMSYSNNQLIARKVHDIDFSQFVKHFEQNPLQLRFEGKVTKDTNEEKELYIEVKSDFCNSKGHVLQKDRLHSSGYVILDKNVKQVEPLVDINSLISITTPMNIDKFYELTDKYINFGTTFRNLNYVGYINEDEIVGEITVTDDAKIFGYTGIADTIISPITIDNAGRLLLFNDFQNTGHVVVPRYIKESVLIRPFRKNEKVYVYCKRLRDNGDTVDFRVQVMDKKGEVIFDIIEISLIRINKYNGDHSLFTEDNTPQELLHSGSQAV
ncbi:SDR family NAD(P)-dependent oxidoreductase [Wukongibacter baidiensis]|uniref:SDR family NAD(P)-dependent oxidoreductase n=1 Tax=Wukongibacter baidiensis TaxID=1723361 RepID=UPI003D7F382A